MRRFIPIFLSLLVLISAAVYTPLSLDKRKSISEVEAKAQLEPSTVDITHDYGRLIQHSPANWTLYNRAVAVNVIWDGTYAYCRLLNNTVDEPWRAYPISYWSMWHFEFLGAGDKWREDVPLQPDQVSFSNAVENASGAYLTETLTLPSLGSKAEITYKVQTDGKLKWDIRFTAGAAKTYRLRYRMDTIPSQHVKLDAAKQIVFTYSPSFNVTFFYDDVNQALHSCSDMYDEGNHRFYFDISLGALSASQSVTIDPSTVGGSYANYAVGYPFQREGFHANGRHWVFYSDSTNILYKTSTDGASWSEAGEIRSGDNGFKFSLHLGSYMHYAYLTGTSSIYYRRGTPNADGSISWSTASEQETAHGNYADYPTVTADSNGYPWIGYRLYDGSNYYPYVIKSSTNDGSWSTASSFPYQLNATSDSTWFVTVLALGQGRVYAIYARSSDKVKGRLWDGNAWGSEETVTASSIQVGRYYSAAAEGDNIHLVFLKASTYDIIYVKRTYGSGWGGEVTVQSAASSSSAPVLALRSTTGTLYTFWAGSPTANHIYYKKYVGGTWDTDPTDWVTDATLTGNDRLTCFMRTEEGGHYLGVLYMRGTSIPYTIRYASLTINTAPTNDACASTSLFGLGVYNWVNVTVSDVDLIADLKTVDVQVNTTGDAESFTLRWTQTSNAFSEVSDPSGICTLGSSVRVNIDSDTDKIAFNFKFTSGSFGLCGVKAISVDDLDASDTDLYANAFTLTDIQLGSLAVASASGTHNTQFNMTATWAHNSSAVKSGSFYVYGSSQLASATSDSSGLVQFTLTGVTLHGSGTLTVNGTKSGVKVNTPLTLSYNITVSGLEVLPDAEYASGKSGSVIVNFKNIAKLDTTYLKLENVSIRWKFLTATETLVWSYMTGISDVNGNTWRNATYSILPAGFTVSGFYTFRTEIIQAGSEYVLATMDKSVYVALSEGGVPLGPGGQFKLTIEPYAVDAPAGTSTVIELPIKVEGVGSFEIVSVTTDLAWVQCAETLPKKMSTLLSTGPLTIKLTATPTSEDVYKCRVTVKVKADSQTVTTASYLTISTYAKAPIPSAEASAIILVGLAGLFGFLMLSGRKKRRGEY